MGWEGNDFKDGAAVKITLEDEANWYGYFRRIAKCRIGSIQERGLFFSPTKDGAAITTPFRIIRQVVEYDPGDVAAKTTRPQPKCVAKRAPRKKAA